MTMEWARNANECTEPSFTLDDGLLIFLVDADVAGLDDDGNDLSADVAEGRGREIERRDGSVGGRVRDLPMDGSPGPGRRDRSGG